MAKLALLGGEKTRTMPLANWPVVGDEDIRAVTDVLTSGHWGIGGGCVDEFESKFSAMHGCSFGTCVVNGTVAIEVALRALGIGPGDEVIVPPYTFIATASSVLMANAVPIFVDIDPDTYNIDPSKIEEAITKRTKAIIAVHIGGLPCDMDAIMAIAQKHSLFVVEDCAQAHLAEWNGKKVGSFGNAGTFSFQSSKNLNCGEGGIVISNDKELAERIWSIHNCGRMKDGAWYEHRILGANYRMTQFQAALLLSQMKCLPEQQKRREENALYLAEKLWQIPGIRPLKRDPKVTCHAYHMFIFRYNPIEFGGLPRARFIEAVRAEGIPISDTYVPLYREELFIVDPDSCPVGCSKYGRRIDYRNLNIPITEKVCNEESIWLWQANFLGPRTDMDDIAAAISKVKDNIGELQQHIILE